MEQIYKRQKTTKESTIHDIASSIRDISESITSVSESYRTLLRVNKAAVWYCQDIKQRQNVTSIDQTQSDLEQITTEEES